MKRMSISAIVAVSTIIGLGLGVALWAHIANRRDRQSEVRRLIINTTAEDVTPRKIVHPSFRKRPLELPATKPAKDKPIAETPADQLQHGIDVMLGESQAYLDGLWNLKNRRQSDQ